MKRSHGNGFCRIIPSAPLFPIIAAAKAGDDENAVFVSEVKQVVRANFSLEAHCVQPHVANEAHLLLFALRSFHEEKVARPTRSTDENGVVIDGVEAAGFRGQLGSD